jgi:RNA polymerase sigma-70 factor (ECF subfamily)
MDLRTQADADFEAHRQRLLTAAYRVLGDRSRAEDVVQDAWLRWARADPGSVRNPPGFLYQTVTRLAIDELRKVAVRNETELLAESEPLLVGHPNDGVELADSVLSALQLVLQTLSPVERAAFLLHEAFGFSHAEIASVTGRTDHAARQLVYRARHKVRAGRGRFAPPRGEREAVVDRFRAAAEFGGDFEALAAACSS